MCRLRLLIGGIFLLVTICPSIAGRQDLAAPTKVSKASLFAGWRSLQARDESGRQYTVVASKSWTKAGDPREKTTIRMSVDKDQLRALATYSDEKQILVGRNPHYAFVLGKKEGKREWFLGTFDEEKRIHANKSLQFLLGTAPQVAYPLSAILGKVGPEHEHSLDIVRVTAEGKLLHRVHYKRSLPAMMGKPAQEVFGEMLVDPTRDCCVLELTMSTRDASTYRLKREVAEVDGQLVCTRIEETLPKGRSATYKFMDYQVQHAGPPLECYLSHYGLPEPIDVTPPPKAQGWWPLALGAAALFSFAGMLFFWRKAGSGKSDKPLAPS